MAKTKRIYYPVNKDVIADCIDKYNKLERPVCDREEWDEYCRECERISPCWHVNVAIHSLFQAMYFSKTLTVDNVYNAIIVSGINTELEEVYDD